MGKHIYAATVSSEMYEPHYRGFLRKVKTIIQYNENSLEEFLNIFFFYEFLQETALRT